MSFLLPVNGRRLCCPAHANIGKYSYVSQSVEQHRKRGYNRWYFVAITLFQSPFWISDIWFHVAVLLIEPLKKYQPKMHVVIGLLVL